jgi:hypothetical protein
LEVEIGRPFATWLGRENTVFLVAYRCNSVAGEVELSPEHQAYRWVDQSNFRERDDGSPPFATLTQYFTEAK